MIWGLLAEFDAPDDLLHAAHSAYARGYRKMDAYSPFPIPKLAEAIGVRKNYVPLTCLTGGLLGGSAAYMLQYWINVISYPMDVAGRPMHSWPSFIPVTFEMSVLFAGFGAFFGMWALNGLPCLFHPLFNVKRFAGVTRDRFFLCIQAADPKFEMADTRAFLRSLAPTFIEEVPYR